MAKGHWVRKKVVVRGYDGVERTVVQRVWVAGVRSTTNNPLSKKNPNRPNLGNVLTPAERKRIAAVKRRAAKLAQAKKELTVAQAVALAQGKRAAARHDAFETVKERQSAVLHNSGLVGRRGGATKPDATAPKTPADKYADYYEAKYAWWQRNDLIERGSKVGGKKDGQSDKDDRKWAKNVREWLRNQRRKSHKTPADVDAINRLSEMYNNYAEDVAKRRNKLIDDVNDKLGWKWKPNTKTAKDTDGKWVQIDATPDIDGARKILRGREWKLVNGEYQRLFGDGKNQGDYAGYWSDYQGIEQQQQDYYKRQMQSALDGNVADLKRQMARARFEGDHEQADQLQRLINIYTGVETRQIPDVDSQGHVIGYHTGNAYESLQAINAEEEARIRTQIEAYRRDAEERAMAADRSIRQSSLLMTDEFGRTVTQGTGFQERPISSYVKRLGVGVITSQRELNQVASQAMALWEQDNPAPPGPKVTGSMGPVTDPAMLTWLARRARFERTFWEHYGQQAPGWFEKTMQLPILNEGLSLIQAGTSGIGGLMRVGNAWVFNETQIGGYRVNLRFLPPDIKNRIRAEADAYYKEQGVAGPGMAAGVYNPNAFLQKWFQTPEGKEWYDREIHRSKVEGLNQLKDFSEGFYAQSPQLDARMKDWDTAHPRPKATDSAAFNRWHNDRLAFENQIRRELGISSDFMDRVDALNAFGSSPTDSDEANLLFQLLVDPTNAIPLKATTWMARAAYASKTQGTFLKSTKLRKLVAFQVDEGTLALEKGAKELADAIGSGVDPQDLIDQLNAATVGIRDVSKLDEAIDSALARLGVNRNHPNYSLIRNTIEHQVRERLATAGKKYSGQEAEERLRQAERQQRASAGRMERKSRRQRAEARRTRGVARRVEHAESTAIPALEKTRKAIEARDAEAIAARKAADEAKAAEAAKKAKEDLRAKDATPAPRTKVETPKRTEPVETMTDVQIVGGRLRARAATLDPVEQAVRRNRYLDQLRREQGGYVSPLLNRLLQRKRKPGRLAPKVRLHANEFAQQDPFGNFFVARMSPEHIALVDRARALEGRLKALEAGSRREPGMLDRYKAAKDEYDRARRDLRRQARRDYTRSMADEERKVGSIRTVRRTPAEFVDLAGSSVDPDAARMVIRDRDVIGELVRKANFGFADDVVSGTTWNPAGGVVPGRIAQEGPAGETAFKAPPGSKMGSSKSTWGWDAVEYAAARGSDVAPDLEVSSAAIGADIILARDQSLLGTKNIYETFSDLNSPLYAVDHFDDHLYRKLQAASTADDPILENALWLVQQAERVADPAYLKSLGPQRMAALLLRLDEDFGMGIAGFRDGGHVLFQLFHNLRDQAMRDVAAAGRKGIKVDAKWMRKNTKIGRLSSSVDAYIEEIGVEGESIFAAMWKVMEERSGLPFADDQIAVEDYFLTVAKGRDLHPNLAMAMIPHGRNAFRAPHRFRLSSALSQAVGKGWKEWDGVKTEWDYLEMVDRIFAGGNDVSSSELVDYVATRFGDFRKAYRLKLRINDGLISHALQATSARYGAKEAQARLAHLLWTKHRGALGDTFKDERSLAAHLRVTARETRVAKGREADLHPSFKPAVHDAVLSAWRAGDLPLRNAEAHKLLLFRELQDYPNRVVGPLGTFFDYMKRIGLEADGRNVIRMVKGDEIDTMVAVYLRDVAPSFHALGVIPDHLDPRVLRALQKKREWQLYAKAGLIPDRARITVALDELAKRTEPIHGNSLLSAAEHRKVREYGQYENDMEFMRDQVRQHERDKGRDAYAGGTDVSEAAARIEEGINAYNIALVDPADPRLFKGSATGGVADWVANAMERFQTGRGSKNVVPSARLWLSGVADGMVRMIERVGGFDGAAATAADVENLRRVSQSLFRRDAKGRYVISGARQLEEALVARLSAESLDRWSHLADVFPQYRLDKAGRVADPGSISQAVAAELPHVKARQKLQKAESKLADMRRIRKNDVERVVVDGKEVERITTTRQVKRKTVVDGKEAERVEQVEVTGTVAQYDAAIRQQEEIVERARAEADRLHIEYVTKTDAEVAAKPVVRRSELDEKFPERPGVVGPEPFEPEVPRTEPVPEPTLAQTQPMAQVERAIWGVTGMTEEQFWTKLGADAQRILSSKTASPAQKAKARTLLSHIREARFARAQAKKRGTHIPDGERRRFARRVRALHGKEIQDLTPPKHISAYHEDAFSLDVEQVRTYRVALRNRPVKGARMRLGYRRTEDYMPHQLYVRLNEEISDAIAEYRKWKANTRTGGRGPKIEEEPDDDNVSIFFDKDPEIVKIKARILHREGISVAAYDQAHGVFRTALRQRRNGTWLIEQATEISQKTGRDYQEVFLELRAKSAQEESIKWFEALAYGKMYGHDPEDIRDEFISRYVDDGTIRYAPKPMTPFQQRSLQEAIREMVGTSDEATVRAFVGMRNLPSMESKAAFRDFLVKIGAWSPRRAEEFTERGLRGWSVEQEARYTLDNFGVVPPWADPVVLDEIGGDFFHNQHMHTAQNVAWGMADNTAEINVRITNADAETIFDAEINGNPLLGFKPKKELELVRRFYADRYGNRVVDANGRFISMPWLMHADELRDYISRRLVEHTPIARGIPQSVEELDAMLAQVNDGINFFWDKYIVSKGDEAIQWEDVFRLASEVTAVIMANPKFGNRWRDILGDTINAHAAMIRWLIFSNPAFVATNIGDVPIKSAWERFSRRGLYDPTGSLSRAKPKLAEGAAALTPQGIGVDVQTTLARLARRPANQRLKNPIGITAMDRAMDRAGAIVGYLPEAGVGAAASAEIAGKMSLARSMYPKVMEAMLKASGDNWDVADAAARRFIGREVQRMWPTAGDGAFERFFNRIVPFSSYQVRNRVLFLSEVVSNPVILNWIDYIGRYIEIKNRQKWEEEHPGQPMSAEYESKLRQVELPWAPGYFFDPSSMSDASRGLDPLVQANRGATPIEMISKWVRLVSPVDQVMFSMMMNSWNVPNGYVYQAIKNDKGFVIGFRKVPGVWTEPWSKEKPTWGSVFWFADVAETVAEYLPDGFSAGEWSMLVGKLTVFSGVSTYNRGAADFEIYKLMRDKNKAAAQAWLASDAGARAREWLQEMGDRTMDIADPDWIKKFTDSGEWWHSQTPETKARIAEGRAFIRSIRENYSNIIYALTPGTMEYQVAQLEAEHYVNKVYEAYPELLMEQAFTSTLQEWTAQMDEWQTDIAFKSYWNLQADEPRRSDYPTQAAFEAAHDAWSLRVRSFHVQFPTVKAELDANRSALQAARDAVEREWDKTFAKIDSLAGMIKAADAHGKETKEMILRFIQDMEYSKLDQDHVVLEYTANDFQIMGDKAGPAALLDSALKKATKLLDFREVRYQKALRENRGQEFLDDERYHREMAEVALIAKGGDPLGKFDPRKWYDEINKRPWLKKRYLDRPENAGKAEEWEKNDKYMRWMQRWVDRIKRDDWDGADAVWNAMPDWVRKRYYRNNPGKRREFQENSAYMAWISRWAKTFDKPGRDSMAFFWKMPSWVREKYFARHPENRTEWEAEAKYATQLTEYFAADPKDRAAYLARHPQLKRWLASNVSSEEKRRQLILIAYQAIPKEDAWLRRIYREKYPEIFSPEAKGEERLKGVYATLKDHPEMLDGFEEWVKAIWASYAEMLTKSGTRPQPLHMVRRVRRPLRYTSMNAMMVKLLSMRSALATTG